MARTKTRQARKPSKVVKPKKSKARYTGPFKNHRFKSFSERIANLKIDPIRQRRRAEDQEELSKDAVTYFGRSLEESKDLNQSASFAAFAKEATPLCDSLPMILHNEQRLVDIVLKYIERGDSLSLEPLLSLLSHLAHDLDSRFEKHFARSVITVASVAAKNTDPAVVEWGFNCLAWLFKYLSRLLTQDLRPLYDLMAPYLGKEVQKPYIIRFTAESLSFLIRKAAAKYDRDREPLRLIIEYMLQDSQNAPDELYQQGVMALLSDSITGLQNDIHSNGLHVLDSALQYLGEHPDGEIFEIVNGVVVHLLHHTREKTFQPIQDIIMKFADDLNASDARPEQIDVAVRLMFTIATVRKGARISNWAPFLRYLFNLIEVHQDAPSSLNESVEGTIVGTVAVVLSTAPIDVLLPYLGAFEKLRSGRWQSHFLQFCDLSARLDRDRYNQFVFPQFQKFLIEAVHDGDEDYLFLRLPALAPPNQSKKLSCPDTLQRRIVDPFDILLQGLDRGERINVEQVAFANISLQAARVLRLGTKAHGDLRTSLMHLLRHVLTKGDDQRRSEDCANFALGSCFAFLLTDDVTPGSDFDGLWELLCAHSPSFVQLERFWFNISAFLKRHRLDQASLEGAHIVALETTLVQCLSLPSHSIRESALDVIQSLYKLHEKQIPEVLEAAISIESTPVHFETSRSISMCIRRLAAATVHQEEDEFLLRAITTYCFGLLHLQLAPACEAAIDVLISLLETSIGEEVATNLAQLWLESTPSDPSHHIFKETLPFLDGDSRGFQVASDFECPNLAKISAICDQVLRSANSGYAYARGRFQSEHHQVPLVSSEAREKALKVLQKIPDIAEKRSRMLVPVLLRWVGSMDAENVDTVETSTTARWNRKDQKAMLAIFAQFNNPKVLFMSKEVYSALLNLCANGDVEIQRSALKAILAWKSTAVKEHQEHLMNLLDDARFRDEVSVFVQDAGQDGEKAVRAGQHAELMPILLRLLYGRALAGRNQDGSSRRRAIFVALSCYGEDVLQMFIDIALGPLKGIDSIQKVGQDESVHVQVPVSLRQQVGMLNMLDDMLETLGPRLVRSGIKIVNAILHCAISASRKLEQSASSEQPQDMSLLRSIRQTGIQSLVKAFTSFRGLEVESHSRIAMEEFVLPRLEKFTSENTQSVSGIIRLLSVFASSAEMQGLVAADDCGVVHALAALLQNSNTRDDVRLFILQGIVDKLLGDSDNAVLSSTQTIVVVRSIGHLLGQEPSKAVLDACVASFGLFSDRIDNQQQAQEVVRICSDLLTRPSRVVSNVTKSGLLKTVLPLFTKYNMPIDTLLYDAICSLFSRLQDQQIRSILSLVLLEICKGDEQLSASAQICQDLNTIGGKLDSADHVRRDAGFTKVFEQYDSFTVQQWQGILHNCLYFIRDSDDLVNRTSASRALERFIDAASTKLEDFRAVLSKDLLPGIVYGMKSSSELVRAEYVRLLGHLVEKTPEWSAVKDMKILTAGGDTEASFFTNVLHIQQHRRLRALRRLSDDASQVSSNSATQILIPLLEHFVFEQAGGDAARALADQTISTLGVLSRVLSWAALRAMFKRYVALLGSEEQEKVALRLLGLVVEAIPPRMISSASSGDDARSRVDLVVKEMLQPLLDFLHHKDESTVDKRMPVAVSVVKIMLALPEEHVSSRLPAVLTDVCQVLRSRSQEARDETRKTLRHIFSLLGPSYLSFILKELRGALKRGYQLHVLSFTVHSLLVNDIDSFQPGDLNQCLSELMSIIMDDIFGVTGQEKEAEEYKSGMKEVKSSKSFDTLELLTKVTPVQQLGRLIQPLQALMSQKLDSKTLRKTDELLLRIRKGVDQNPAADSRDMLIFCHEIVRNVKTASLAAGADTSAASYQKPKASKRSPSNSRSSSAFYSSSMTAFAFNLVRRVLRRHDDLMTSSNLAGFLPVINEAFAQGQGEVQLAATKLLATIVKVLKNDPDTCAFYVSEAIASIKAAPNTMAESARASLDLISSILRENPSAPVSDKNVASVLNALKSDLDEPDRQGAIYKLLRAILGRKIMIGEVYEVMDDVGKVLVTNADRTVRESARSVYLQFILEYPQSKKRWKKVTIGLTENLKYEHSAGRQSTMEVLHQLFLKLSEDTVSALIDDKLFATLVILQYGDSDPSCRQMARILLYKLFERVGDECMSRWLEVMSVWLQNDDKADVRTASLQCWVILLEARPPPTKQVVYLRDGIGRILQVNKNDHNTIEAALVVDSLKAFAAVTKAVPDVAFATQSNIIWKALNNLVVHTDGELSELAGKLTEVYFSHLASSTAKSGKDLSTSPLRGSEGLELTADDMHQFCFSNLRALSNLDETKDGLAVQIVRNLAFLARCFAANKMRRRQKDRDDDAGDETDARWDSSALAYLFNRLSYTIRQENMHAVARRTAIDCQLAIVNATHEVQDTRTTLRSLYILTDPSVPQSDSMLTDKARELMDVIQKQVGSEAYINELGAVRTNTSERRDERRRKRRIEAVTMPGKKRKIK